MRFIREEFVAVTGETGVLRKRQDAEGAFLRAALGPDFFITSTGYKACVSASGRNLGEDPHRALAAYRKLPDEERKAGAVKVGELDPEDVSVAPPAPPAGGVILKIYGRFLARDGKGELRHSTAKDFPRMTEYKPDQELRSGYLFETSYTDFLWLTEADWKALVPADPKVGDVAEAPVVFTHRLCIFHLAPRRLFGEGGGFDRRSIRAAELKLTVESLSETSVGMRLKGFARMGSVFDAEAAAAVDGPGFRLGFEPELHGFVVYDRGRKAITRFDLIAVGDCWGRLGDANGNPTSVERPGRFPIAFAFELADPAVPANRLIPAGRADRVRPGGVYWSTGK